MTPLLNSLASLNAHSSDGVPSHATESPPWLVSLLEQPSRACETSLRHEVFEPLKPFVHDADFVRRYDRMMVLSDPRLRPLSEDECNELASLIFYVRTEADRRLCSVPSRMTHLIKISTP